MLEFEKLFEGSTDKLGQILQRLLGLLARLDGPGYRGREDRDAAVQELCALQPAMLHAALASLLDGSDQEIRCSAVLAAVLADRQSGVAMVLPLLEDNDSTVRWHVSGVLHDFGDERAVDALILRMRSDCDPQVRGTAAYALGGIRNPKAIPALIETLEADHELDQLGHSPSSSAAKALDDILGMDETCIHLPGGFCKLREGEPDLEKLKAMAMEMYQRWRQRVPGVN